MSPAGWSVRAVAAAMLLVAPASRASAQEVIPGTVDVIDVWNRIRNKAPDQTSSEDDHRRTMKAWAPVIGGKPSAGVMVGVAGNVAFFLGEPQSTRISSLVASATFSTKRQTALLGRFTLFTEEDRWRLEGDNRAQWTSQDTFRLGTSSESDSGVNARFNFFRVHETAFRRLRPGLFAGLGLHFDDHSSIRPGDEVSDDEWNDGAFVQYSRTYNLPTDRQVSAGLSADAVVDTRDSAIDPRRGLFAAASYRGLIKGFLGGSSEWQLLHLEGRAYAALAGSGRQRLAVWVFGDAALGGVAPYFDLPSTGMDTYGRSARGYAEGRFRGERLLYSEAEYRTAVTANGLIGLVAFLNVTTVANQQTGERLFDTAALGGGAGLRVLLNKRSRTNLCVDFGVGEGSRGVYLAVQEAF